MQFRPCIDIHNGKVKQIVGATLSDVTNDVKENFVSEKNAAYYAELYKKDGIKGGHVILLNTRGSEYYEATRKEALKALEAYPVGLQVGGGIRDDNAREFLEAGASHVIVTSFVFKDGEINWENLKKISSDIGKEHLVLDLSCKARGGKYYIVTERWQNFTDVEVSVETLEKLSEYCDEFLIHASDVEGQKGGIDIRLIKILSEYKGIPLTYAGGIGSYEDIEELREAADGKINFTIGSALDLFGGELEYKEIVRRYC